MNKQEILDKVKKNDKKADVLIEKAKQLQQQAYSLLNENKELIEQYQKNE